LTVTIPLALVLGVAVAILCRWAGLRVWQAAVCVAFGFYLASTGFAPYVSQFISSLFRSF
jgi:hypothetical protein